MAKRLSKKKPKKPKPPPVRTQRAQIKTETVASPWNNGFDKIKRVVDTISAMEKRKQLSKPQADAARRCQDAYEACGGSIKSPLDDSNLSGGSPGSRMPSPRALLAAGTLEEVRKRCGETQTTLIIMIACQGQSIQDATAIMCGKGADGKCRKRDLDAIGWMFRDALEVLARRWFGTNKRKEHPAFVPDWAKPVNIVGDGEISREANAASFGYDKQGRFEAKRKGK